MSASALAADRFFDGHQLGGPGGVLLRDGAIAETFSGEAPAGVPVERVSGLLTPGFVDLQVNGGGGVLLNDAPDADGMAAIARAHRSQGTTALLPTLISPGRALLKRAMGHLPRALESLPGQGLRILGLHVEGPALNPVRAGAHAPETLRDLDPAELAALAALPGTRLVTVAPERVGEAAIADLVHAGVHVFAGHTEASASVFGTARRAGLRGVTHLYNAMPPAINRAPGVVGAVLGDPEAFAGIIADGAHVDWASFRAARAALGADRLFLVSDAMSPVGADPAPPFSLGAGAIAVRGRGDGRYCAMEDGTLAGSCLTLAAALRNAVREAQTPLEDALRMVTSTPARAIEREREVGVLRAGAHADLVLLDDALAVQRVWVGGVAAARD